MIGNVPIRRDDHLRDLAENQGIRSQCTDYIKPDARTWGEYTLPLVEHPGFADGEEPKQAGLRAT